MRAEKFQELRNENPFCHINDVVYQYLLEEIITIQMAPEEPINISNLAKVLDTSRTPIQSALERLEKDSLVEKNPGKAYRVAPITYEEYAQLIQFRNAVESEAAYYAAKKISIAALEELKHLLVQGKEAENDWEKLCGIDQRFHQIIIQSAKNKYFDYAYESYKNIMLRYRYYVSSKGLQQGMHFKELHLGLYHALKSRVSDQARNEMQYIVSSMSQIIRYFI